MWPTEGHKERVSGKKCCFCPLNGKKPINFPKGNFLQDHCSSKQILVMSCLYGLKSANVWFIMYPQLFTTIFTTLSTHLNTALMTSAKQDVSCQKLAFLKPILPQKQGNNGWTGSGSLMYYCTIKGQYI